MTNMSKFENPNFSVDESTAYVNHEEAKGINELYADIGYWEQKAEKCGCPQCTKSYQASWDRYWGEIERLGDITNDHEEDWIRSKLPAKVYERKPKTDQS